MRIDSRCLHDEAQLGGFVDGRVAELQLNGWPCRDMLRKNALLRGIQLETIHRSKVHRESEMKQMQMYEAAVAVYERGRSGLRMKVEDIGEMGASLAEGILEWVGSQDMAPVIVVV